MPLALVLSAGAMFGAWQVGVWKAFYGRVHPDLIVGASAGAWNGWMIAGGATPEDLAREWLDPLTGKLLHFSVHRAGIVRPDALETRARELFDRFKPRIPFGLVVVEVRHLRPQLVRDTEITWKHLMATAAIPFCFPPVTIDGKRYVDGGVLAALPLVAAEAMGATEAIALNVLTTLPFRALRRVLRPRAPSAALKVTHIEPCRGLGRLRDAAVWSRTNIERWIEEGERDGNRALTSITM